MEGTGTNGNYWGDARSRHLDDDTGLMAYSIYVYALNTSKPLLSFTYENAADQDGDDLMGFQRHALSIAGDRRDDIYPGSVRRSGGFVAMSPMGSLPLSCICRPCSGVSNALSLNYFIAQPVLYRTELITFSIINWQLKPKTPAVTVFSPDRTSLNGLSRNELVTLVE